VLGFGVLSEDHAGAEVELRLQAFLSVPLGFIDYAEHRRSFSQPRSGKHLGCLVRINIVLNDPWRCGSLRRIAHEHSLPYTNVARFG